MDDKLKIVVGTQQEWEAGTLPPQADSKAVPGMVQLYRPTPTFTRSSTAYLPDGIQVASSLARYWYGRYTNMVCANQASGGDTSRDYGGFYGYWNTPVAYDSTTSHSGSGSIKVSVTQALLNGDVYNTHGVIVAVSEIPHRLAANRTAFVSCWVKGPAGKIVAIQGRPDEGLGEGLGSKSFTLTGDWQRVSTSYTCATEFKPGFQIVVNRDQGTFDYYVDDLQAEPEFLTDWKPGLTGKALMIEEGTTNLVMNSDFEVLNPTKQRVFYDDFNRAGSATFTRASVANNPITGASVASGAPRYVPGRFQNVLSTNQSDVETDLSGWSGYNHIMTRDTTKAWQGAASIKSQADATTSVFGPYIGVAADTRPRIVVGRTYIASAYILQGQGSYSVRATIEWKNSAGASFSSSGGTAVALSGSWQRISAYGTAPANAESVTITFYTTASAAIVGDYFFVDGVQLEEAVAGKTNPTDWRPGGSGKGGFVEEGTTNLLTNSSFETFSGTKDDATEDTFGPWFKGTWDANAKTFAVSGTTYGTTSVKIDASTSTGESHFAQGITVVSGNTYTFSVLASGTGTLNMHFSGNTTAQSTNFTLTSTPTWCSITALASSTNLTPVIAATAGAIIVADAAQLENKPYRTSFVDGTRNAELLTIPTTYMSATTGTIEGWAKADYIGTGYKSVFNALDGNVPMMFNLQRSGSDLFLFYRNTSGATLQGASLFTVDMNLHYYAVTWDNAVSTLKLYIDGVLKKTIIDYQADTAATGTSIRIGSSGGTDEKWNGWFDAIRASNVVRTQSEITAYFNATSPLLDDKTVMLLNFDDDLDGEATVQAGWNLLYGSGTYKIKGNQLLLQSANQVDEFALRHGDSEWTDVTITAKFTSVNVGENDLIFRAKDSSNFYQMFWYPTSGTMTLYRRTSTAYTQIASAAYSIAIGNTYYLKVVLVGSSITCSISTDGITYTQLLSVTDTTHSSGFIAVKSNGATTYWDDIEVKADVPDGWSVNVNPYSSPANRPFRWGGRFAMTSGYNSGRAIKVSGNDLPNSGVNSDNLAVVSKYLRIEPNTTYTLSFKYKLLTTKTGMNAYVLNETTNGGTHVQWYTSNLPAGTGWQTFTATFKTTNDFGAGVSQFVRFDADGDSAYVVDCVQLEQKEYSTSYQRNDSLTAANTRQQESLTVPATRLSETGPWTIECWAQAGNSPTHRMPFASWPKFYVDLNQSNKVQLSWEDAQHVQQAVVAPTAVSNPTAHHYWVMTFDGSTAVVYLDGVPVITQGTTLPQVFNGTTLTFGNMSPISVYPLNGLIQHARVSTVVRSPAEVLATYNSASPALDDKNTLALLSFDSTLTSVYPPSTTIVTKSIDLGDIHAGPLDVTVVGNTASGTEAKIKRYRTSIDGINWTEWSDV